LLLLRIAQQDEAPEQSNHQRKPSVLQKAGRWVRTRLGRGRGDGDPEADPVSDPADDAEYFLEKLALGASAQEMEGGGGSRGRCLCCASGKARCCPRAIDPSKPFHYRVSDHAIHSLFATLQQTPLAAARNNPIC
jgi:hypothetical protein